ncbi:hypothetical protein OAX11_04670, partial [Flavobacteriaceae bacterium]|nr:hypothetical protein [Flavobacteriaceae bacterium]
MRNDNLIGITICAIILSPALYQLIIVFIQFKKGKEINWKKIKKITKVLISCLIISLLFIVKLNEINFLNYKKPIAFNKINRITLNDFRGFEFFKKSLYGNERFAYIVTSIEIDVEDDYINIYSLFHPSKSFVYNRKSNSKELLNHEMYHFKITELFARKIKEEIDILKNKTKENIDEIINSNLKKEKYYQIAYDKDTFHSYVLKEQKKYEKNIDS